MPRARLIGIRADFLRRAQLDQADRAHLAGHAPLVGTEVGSDIARQSGRIGADHDHNLAARVDSAIILGPAIAHEHDACGEVERPGLVQRRQHDMLAEREGGAADGKAGRAGLGGDAERHLLIPAAIAAAGAQAERRELRSDVARGDLMPARPGVAALQEVVGQEHDVAAEGGRFETERRAPRRVLDLRRRGRVDRRAGAGRIARLEGGCGGRKGESGKTRCHQQLGAHRCSCGLESVLRR